MMFKIMLQINSIVLSIYILVVVSGAPVADNNGVKIESYNYKSTNDQNGYKFNYQLSDGQAREEEGVFKTDADGVEKYFVSGSYQYVGPDNVEYTVYYTADENGFHPFGDHIPGSLSILSTPMPPPLGLPPNAIASLIG